MKIICMYLPQYHEIPENNKWWGKGYTEWNSVKKAKPLFKGHYQPFEPLNDNYYDLTDRNSLIWQANLAMKYGIYGFCLYHYWFNGKQLLEKPVELYISDPEPDFPFCVAWAYESWTRTWYGDKQTILMRQNVGTKEDWSNHFKYFNNLFSDKRYIKVKNKPMLLLCRSSAIEPLQEMLRLWDHMAKEIGFDGLYVVSIRRADEIDERNHLFSAYMDFEPGFTLGHEMGNAWKMFHVFDIRMRKLYNTLPFSSKFVENIVSYNEITNRIMNRSISQNSTKTYLGTFPSWDDTPRRGYRGSLYTGASPEKFGHCLRNILKKSKKIGNEFVFINAWNEWGEGAYLEPDKKNGYKYLEEIKNAIEKEY